MSKIHIANGTLFTMRADGRILPSTDLFIDGRTIAAIAPDKPSFPLTEIDQTIDATGCYVLPGFVNAHGHLALALFRGLGEFLPGHAFSDHFRRQAALAEHLEAEDYYLGAQLLIAEMIRAGITSFADIHYEPPGSPPVTELIAEAVENTGIRAAVCLETMGYLNTGGINLKYVPEEADRTLANSIRLATKWHGRADGRLTIMLGLANPPVPMPRDLAAVAAAARETGLPIQMHLAEFAYEMVEWHQLYGQRPAAVLREAGILDHHVLGGNVVFLNEEDAAVLRDHPFHASTCPQNCCKLTLGMLDIPLMLDNGVNVCLGTNEVVNNNNLDMIEEMRFAALYHKMQRHDPRILAGDEPLRLITERSGRALGTGVGVLEAGRPADVILLDAGGPHMHPAHNPLAAVIYALSSADVRTVIINGRVIMENRQMLTFDDQAVITRLEERLRPLRALLPAAEPDGRHLNNEPFELRWEAERVL